MEVLEERVYEVVATCPECNSSFTIESDQLGEFEMPCGNCGAEMPVVVDGATSPPAQVQQQQRQPQTRKRRRKKRRPGSSALAARSREHLDQRMSGMDKYPSVCTAVFTIDMILMALALVVMLANTRGQPVHVLALGCLIVGVRLLADMLMLVRVKAGTYIAWIGVAFGALGVLLALFAFFASKLHPVAFGIAAIRFVYLFFYAFAVVQLYKWATWQEKQKMQQSSRKKQKVRKN